VYEVESNTRERERERDRERERQRETERGRERQREREWFMDDLWSQSVRTRESDFLDLFLQPWARDPYHLVHRDQLHPHLCLPEITPSKK
jgi:hypothetical protein